MMEITAELQSNISKWCEELRSGKWKQAKGRLQFGDGFCCLGVLAKTQILPDAQNVLDDKLCGLGLEDQQKAPQWMREINNDFVARIEDEGGIGLDWHSRLGGRASLMNLNDRGDFSFDEIADCLEAVYIHKVLD